MIKELHLNNFKKHAHRSFYFTPGLNGIFGPNYTGKTTILYGILFALGGASQVPGTNLQRKGTNSGMCVKMLMEVDGVEYLIDRKKTGAYLYQVPDVLLASGTSNVNEKIQDLIGMPIKRFRQLKYAEQKKAHALLTLGATELHKIIEELTGIDQINEALSKLKVIIAESKGALDVLSYTDPEPLHSEEEDLAEQKSELTDQLEEATGKCNSAYDKLVDLQAEHSIKTSHRAMHAQEKSEVAALETTLEVRQRDLEQQKRRLGDPLDQAARKRREEDIQDEIVTLENKKARLSEYTATAGVLKKKLAEAVHFVKETARHIEEDQSEADKIDPEISSIVESLNEQHSRARDEMNACFQEFQNQKKIFEDSFCPTCKRKLDDADQKFSEEEIQELDDKVEELRDKIRDLTYDKEKATSEKIFREDALQNIKRNRDALEKEMKHIAELEEQIREADKSAAFIGSKDDLLFNLKNLRLEQNKILKELAEHDEAENKVNAILSEMQELKKAINNRPDLPAFSEEEYKKLEEKIEAAKKDNDKWKDEALRVGQILTEVSSKLGSVRREVALIEKHNEQYETAKKRHGTATALRKFLTDNRDRYTSEIWEFFMGTASSFVSACTSGTITEIQRTSGGKFQFIEDDQEMDIKDASGAQEAIMGLAVQLALAESAQCPLDILLVDEPTADMDAEHSMAVAGVLSTKGSQIIAISHREMDSSLCQNVINL